MEGFIKDRNWHGEEGMEHARTIQEPKQPIPTFVETIALLMKVSCLQSQARKHTRASHIKQPKPENQHVTFNVDVKVQNDPDRLFSLMNDIITSHSDWETLLAPRLLLGLWHPRFLPSAKSKLPYCRRSYIGVSPSIARQYFWKDVDSFSIAFGSLATMDGEKFVPFLVSSP
jgi:phosphatidylglycerol phospholipase C